MSAHQSIVDVIEPLLKDRKLAIKIANQAITALDNGGWFTTEDEHLAMMRRARLRLAKAIDDEDCPARDLAALINRMQAVSKEVTMLEEKEAQEKQGKRGGGSGKSNTAGTTDEPFDPTQA